MDEQEQQFVGKKVPWAQLEEYLAVHQGTIQSFLDQLKNKVMNKATIETLLPNSFWIIHQTVTKILKDNKISPNEEEESKVNQLEFIVKTVMKLQSSLIT